MSIFLVFVGHAQTDSLVQSVPIDTTVIPIVSGEDNLPFSSDTLENNVDYDADSIIVNNVTRFIYLYGNAMVTYGTYSISGADYIEIDLDSNLAVAQQWPDSLKVRLPQVEGPEEEPEDIVQTEVSEEEPVDAFEDDPLFNSPDSLERELFDPNRNRPNQPIEALEAKNGQPTFKGEGQEFIAKHLKFNFETKRGKIFGVRTQQQNLYVLGRESKFLGATEDTIQSDDQLNARSTLLTTCTHEVPHYGIRSSKQKIIPGKQAIFGPSNVEIAGIPTPLFLPFGFFPISDGPQNGLIFPSDYEFSEQWGFGLRDIGYYLPLSEKIDVKILGGYIFQW